MKVGEFTLEGLDVRPEAEGAVVERAGQRGVEFGAQVLDLQLEIEVRDGNRFGHTRLRLETGRKQVDTFQKSSARIPC